MTFKDLENEGWIKFEGCDDLNTEIPKKELCKILLKSYQEHIKYNNGKVDLKLKERYDKIDDILRPLKNITSILYIKDAKLESRKYSNEYNDFIMVKVKNETEILLNVTTGEDLSINYNNALEIIENKTEIKYLYTLNKKDYQGDIEIGKIESVTLYKNVDIYNSVSNNNVNDSDIMEIKDIKGNVFYVDILFNNIYKRDNIYYLEKNPKTKELLIFKINKKNNFNIKKFNNRLFNILSIFYDFD